MQSPHVPPPAGHATEQDGDAQQPHDGDAWNEPIDLAEADAPERKSGAPEVAGPEPHPPGVEARATSRGRRTRCCCRASRRANVVDLRGVRNRRRLAPE